MDIKAGEVFAPRFKVRINNAFIPDEVYNTITEVSVRPGINAAGSFSIRLSNPDLELIDVKNGLFSEGNLVEISMGYVNNMKIMMLGEISVVNLHMQGPRSVSIDVEGFDLLHRMTRGVAFEIFRQDTDKNANQIMISSLVEKMAKQVGIKKGNCSMEKISAQFQANESNYAILSRIARENNMDFWMENDKLHFDKKNLFPKIIKLDWSLLSSFSKRLSTAGVVGKIEAYTLNIKSTGAERHTEEFYDKLSGTISKQGITQIKRGSGQNATMVLTARDAADTIDAAKKRARNEKEKVIESLKKASGSSVGHPDIQLKTILRIEGVGRFSGDYAVESVEHSIGASGYTTNFELGGL